MHSTVIVGTIPFHEGKILLVRNKNEDTWYPPSGKLAPNENLEKGAIRETFEETGLRVRVDQVFYVKEYYNVDKTRIFLKFVWISKPFSVQDVPGDFVYPEETLPDGKIAERKWFLKSDLQKINIEPKECQDLLWDIIEQRPLPKSYPIIEPYYGSQ